jgi:hypothetical protein
VPFIEEGGTAPRLIAHAPTRIAFVGSCPDGILEPLTFASAEDAVAFAARTGPEDTLGYAACDFFAAGGRSAVVTAVPTGKPLRPAFEALDAVPDVGVVALCPPTSTGLTAADAQAGADYVSARRAVLLLAPAGAGADQHPDHLPELVAALQLNDRQRSSVAAYGPWLLRGERRAGTPVTPIGAVAGVLAHLDRIRGLWRAPAGAEATLPAGLRPVPRAAPEVLAAAGVNLVGDFPGHGVAIWGARTLADLASGWRYLPVRRLALHIERSLERGLQWVVCEPNGPALWDQVALTVTDFLHGLWQAGALQGQVPQEGFFVRCDRSTMTQNDLDNGRLVVLVGIAPLRPAEFTVIRIGIPTASTP